MARRLPVFPAGRPAGLIGVARTVEARMDRVKPVPTAEAANFFAGAEAALENPVTRK